MKKILTLTFALLCMVSAFAANVDIIIKTNSEKIEALIQEVSETEIKYKKANNPTGPIYIVNMSEIATILYANGDVQAVEHKAEPAQQQGTYNFSYGFSTLPESEQLKYLGHNEYSINGKILKGRELDFFLKENCPKARVYYQKFETMEKVGWSFFAIGPAIFAAGIIYSYTIKSYDWEPGTYAICSVGGSILLTSIPLIACGNVYKKRVDKFYNTYCGKPQAFQPELRLTSGNNGLGLALAF